MAKIKGVERDHMDALGYEKLRDDFLKCRMYRGHAWDEVVGDDIPEPGDGWLLTSQCMRCKSRRVDVISFNTGDLVRRRYDYPDGYQLDEKVTITELRTEFGRRNNYIEIIARRNKR